MTPKKKYNSKRLAKPRSAVPTLRFSPTAWAKLLYLRDRGDTEVGGFGISSALTPLLVSDIRLVKQSCTAVSVSFDDLAVADYFEEQVDQGLRPADFARLWIHTHPGDSPQPSWLDEETFARVFGATDWAVMFILARGGQSYARLRLNPGIAAELMIPAEVDYGEAFGASDFMAWQQEYQVCVHRAPVFSALPIDTTAMTNVEPPLLLDDATWPDVAEDWPLQRNLDLYEGTIHDDF